MQDNSFYSKYKYIRPLGHGGCGDVFLAENKALGNFWAIKEITKGTKTSISGYNEPEILKRLNHPALPRICDVHEDETKIYIVEDYIEGTCLKQELDIKGKFDEQTVLDWAIQLCSVLEYLHCQKPNPIIYGDMKPHNIILTQEGFVKLIDFGVSALMNIEDELASSNDTAFIGTKGYAAPEQFTGNGISRTSDIYSLGVTLLQLITGIDPLKNIAFFQNEKYIDYLSPGLFEILRKCTHSNPELRYKSAGMLMKDLRHYSASEGVSNPLQSKEALHFTKIIAITGARGTGVSTITAALAECMARGPTSVCIVNLSPSNRLGESLGVKKEKVKSNLYYININEQIEKISSDDQIIHKHLGKLQEKFPYIFIDVDITLIKFIEQYLNHIFIVSDMNPFNAVQIGQSLEIEGLVDNFKSKTSFIINKYYKGELSSRNILRSIFVHENASQQLQDLIIYAKTFEISYDPKVYLRWAYSFFGEPLRFKNYAGEHFQKAISNILSNVVLPKKKNQPRFTISDLMNKIGGIG